MLSLTCNKVLHSGSHTHFCLDCLCMIVKSGEGELCSLQRTVNVNWIDVDFAFTCDVYVVSDLG